MKKYGLCIFFMVFVIACTEKVAFESFVEFEDQNWYIDSVATFNFEVKEVQKSYKIDGYIRNTLDYPFYNLYIQYELLNDEGVILRSSLKENNLMDRQTGKPLGKGSGSVYDVTFPLIDFYTFEKTGNYQLKLKQYMRLDTLSGIQAVGLRLASIKPEMQP